MFQLLEILAYFGIQKFSTGFRMIRKVSGLAILFPFYFLLDGVFAFYNFIPP